MSDEQGPDSKVVAVPSRDPRYADAEELDDLSEFQRDSIQHFFEEYKSLEAGKHVTAGEWLGSEAAEAEIVRARQRLGG
jgi:inorganic pyrophosphatase